MLRVYEGDIDTTLRSNQRSSLPSSIVTKRINAIVSVSLRLRSIALAVSLPIEDIQCEYVVNVICTDAWPKDF